MRRKILSLIWTVDASKNEGYPVLRTPAAVSAPSAPIAPTEPTAATTTGGVTVKLNGNVLAFDQPAVIINGRTMVPVRGILEAMKATVEWNGATRTVKSYRENYSIALTIGQSTLVKAIDGVSKGITLDTPTMILNGRTLVPARAVAKAYDCTVEWDNATRTVNIWDIGSV